MDKGNVKVNATYSEIKKTGDEPLEWELNRGPEYWEYRKKWEECANKQIVPKGPIHLDIETTNACNLKCKMCFRNALAEKKEFKQGFIELAFFSDLIDQAIDLNVCSVKFNYLGEPLLHPDVVKQVAYAKKRGVIEVMFNTNAVLLTAEMSRQLLDAGLDSLFFSVDSPYPEKYNEIRKGADFHKVFKNIENFMKVKENGGYKHVQTRVSIVLMDQCKEELKEYENMFLDLVGTVGYGEYFDRDKDYGAELGFVEGFACSQPFQRMFVHWDGKTTMCCWDYAGQKVIGNAHRTPLIDIWQCDEFNKLRDHMKIGTYYKSPLCRHCYLPHAKLG